MNHFQRFFPAQKLRSLRTPSFVYSRQAIETQMDTLIKTFQEILPTEIVYSYKTNPFIAAELLKINSKVLVSTFHELRFITQKTKPSLIYYYNPHARGMEIKEVVKLGVTNLILDSREQVDALLRVNPVKALKILLRINTHVQMKDNAYQRADRIKKHGFGIEMDDSIDVFKLLSVQRFAKSLGIHSHLGTHNCDIDSWKKNTERLLRLSKELKRKNIEIETIDLGGGFPVDYGSEVLSINEIFSAVKKPLIGIRELYPNIKLILEPGRFLAAPSCVLLAHVIAKKRNMDGVTLSLNTSVYAGSLDTLIAGLRLPVKNLDNAGRKKKIKCIIRGNTPDTIDIFCTQKMPEPDIGDRMIFLNAGAYNFSTDFCSLRRPKNVWID